MGKASKKKAQRRQGAGQSRAEIEQERAAGRQERANLQASQALSELADIARSLQQTEAENVKAWWGGAPVVPATIPEWDAESLGHYFFSDSNIVKTAAAPPLTAAVIPEPEKLAADRGLLTGAVSALTRAVVFEGVKAGDPALDPFLDLLTPAVEKEIEYATANNSYSNGPLYHFDVFPLFYATLAVVGHEDTLTALLPVLARHFDVALTGIGVTTLTGVQITEALFRALLEDYRFEDPEDADLLARLRREKTHGTGLMQLVRSTLVAPEDAFRVGLAVLAQLAEVCRTNASPYWARDNYGAGTAQDDFRLRRAALSRGAAGAPDALYDELITLTGITADDAILEIGTGSGKATLPLVRRGYRITCVEPGAELAAEATKNLAEFPRVSVVNADFEK